MSEYQPIDEFDPLAKLYKAEKALIAAGARGEAVVEPLKDIRNAISSLIEQRGSRERVRYRERE